MGTIIDIKGQKFGKLTVIKFYGRNKDNKALWFCQCDCGNTKIATGKSLRKGYTKSCGCLITEMLINRNYVHGKRYTRLYRIWLMMKNRCNNPKEKFYHCYGGKGIKVCGDWLNNFNSFYEWSIANGYDSNLTIDRIDLNKGYQPDNCRWVTNKEQQNNKSTNHYITYNGKTQSMKKWADEIGIGYSTLRARINVYKWDIETALTAPKGFKCKNKTEKMV